MKFKSIQRAQPYRISIAALQPYHVPSRVAWRPNNLLAAKDHSGVVRSHLSFTLSVVPRGLTAFGTAPLALSVWAWRRQYLGRTTFPFVSIETRLLWALRHFAALCGTLRRFQQPCLTTLISCFTRLINSDLYKFRSLLKQHNQQQLNEQLLKHLLRNNNNYDIFQSNFPLCARVTSRYSHRMSRITFHVVQLRKYYSSCTNTNTYFIHSKHSFNSSTFSISRCNRFHASKAKATAESCQCHHFTSSQSPKSYDSCLFTF